MSNPPNNVAPSSDLTVRSVLPDGADVLALVTQLRQLACPHDLVEVLSVNGRNLDGAVRRCVYCAANVGAGGAR